MLKSPKDAKALFDYLAGDQELLKSEPLLKEHIEQMLAQAAALAKSDKELAQSLSRHFATNMGLILICLFVAREVKHGVVSSELLHYWLNRLRREFTRFNPSNVKELALKREKDDEVTHDWYG
mmetsp:Transcript_32993/g.50512  ORF Transcript_32993/g.50512 Transcript_32993/m.50512 type:complete len:123 (-) Transcript_32993:30-398(-)